MPVINNGGFTVASPFRDNAIASLSNSQDVRSRTSLISPRRWLVALAVIALLIVGLLYSAINSLVTPAQGVGWMDKGGFTTITAPVSGLMNDASITTGKSVQEGEVLGRILESNGVTTEVLAPQDAVVMQYAGESSQWSVTAGDPLMTLAITSRDPQLFILLPGSNATGLTRGDVVVGAKAWAEPDLGKPVECTVAALTPYEQPGIGAVTYMPAPSVAQFVQSTNSVQWAKAECPSSAYTQWLVGKVMPVTVELENRGLLSFVFGGLS